MRNPTAEMFPATNDEYHARAEELGHTEVEEFIEDPAGYHLTRVTKELPPKPPTPEMQFGSLLHAYILEPRTVIEIPADMLGKGGIKAGHEWKAFRDSHPAGTFLVKADEMLLLRQIERAIEAHEKARVILREGQHEINVRWQDEETGIWCRCRIDAAHPGWLLGDLKSAARIGPKPFIDAILRYGYHRQAAWYQDGWQAYSGERLPFVFVPVTKEQPFQAAAYEIFQRFIEIGRRQNRRALWRLKECHQTGQWTYPGHGTIRTLDAPAYAETNSQWE